MDVYSFSHVVDGILFFALMVLVGRGMPMATRFVLALSLATGWELFENSSFIIHHYRAETIPLGYFGDSILNSCSDIAMMALGFWFASRMRVGLRRGGDGHGALLPALLSRQPVLDHHPAGASRRGDPGVAVGRPLVALSNH